MDVHVTVSIHDSPDSTLQGRALSGWIRACDTDIDGKVTDVLIQLDQAVDYNGHYSQHAIGWVVASPCLRCDRTEGLLLASAAVRIVDALSLGDIRYDRTIAVGRLRFIGRELW